MEELLGIRQLQPSRGGELFIIKSEGSISKARAARLVGQVEIQAFNLGSTGRRPIISYRNLR